MATGRTIICACCGELPASCIGAYEGEETEQPACDECCAHGNEDGHCEPLYTDPETAGTRAFAAAVDIVTGGGR